MPDGHAYQYVTAALDLSIATGADNLLVCDEHGELITTTRLTSPAPHTPARRARRAAAAVPGSRGGLPAPAPLRTRYVEFHVTGCMSRDTVMLKTRSTRAVLPAQRDFCG